MTYFKIIKNDNVVSVGTVFLKWNSKKNRMFACDVNEGQFVQTYDEEKIYTAYWLKQAPEDAPKYEEAEVVAIDKVEFDDLKELLTEGEEVPVEQEPEYTPTVHDNDEAEEEKPLTIAEMRLLIINQQKQIEDLLQRLNP